MMPKKESDSIVTISPNTCSYVDDHYFENVVGENVNNPNNLTYAVKIKSIQADWIINEKIGLEFLIEMLKQQKLDLFHTPYM